MYSLLSLVREITEENSDGASYANVMFDVSKKATYLILYFVSSKYTFKRILQGS